MLYYVAQYVHLECIEPHDKIFGLLPLSDEEETYQVDYNLKLEELFLRLHCQEPTSSRRRHEIMSRLGISTQSILDHVHCEEVIGTSQGLCFRTAIKEYRCGVTACFEGYSIVLPEALDTDRCMVGCICLNFPQTHFLLRLDRFPTSDPLLDPRLIVVGLLDEHGSIEESITPNAHYRWADHLAIEEFGRMLQHLTILEAHMSKLAFAVLVDRTKPAAEEDFPRLENLDFQ